MSETTHVIVTAADTTRKFAAGSWAIHEDSQLDLVGDEGIVASYAPGTWISVHYARAASPEHADGDLEAS